MRQTLAEFEGLDTRRLESLADMKTARAALNVYITSGRVWRSRPGLQLMAQLPAETKGLYAANGVLRTIAPAGYADIYNQQSPLIFFDFVGDGGAYDRNDVQEMINVERFGSSVSAGVQPYGVIRRRSTGLLEHHWFRHRPGSPSGVVNNKIALPFVPSGMVTKLSETLWTPCQAAGSVPFSSTEFGPSDWATLNDAGFLPVLGHTPGDHTITGLGFMQGTEAVADRRQSALVVFFEDSIQIWAVDPEPINHYLTGNIGGIGTRNYRSIANVLGDPVFFARGGFASLRASSRGGALDSAKIGGPIERLTAALGADAITASVWWDAKGLYLCAAGSTIYVWRYDPFTKTKAWSVWELPFAVTDLVDFQDDLYLRASNNRVYKFSDALDKDDGAPVVFDLETQFLHMSTPGSVKTFQTANIHQRGTSSISFRPDATHPDIEIPIYRTDGITPHNALLPINASADSVALRFTGTGPWELDGVTIDYDGR
jgi:hypothetical protein